MLKALGWTAVEPPVPEDKCVILGVPHTTIWDFAISYLYYTSVGGKAYCMVKKEFFRWPLGPIIRKMGGVPVDRTNGASVVLSVVHEMNSRKTMHLALAPEGTRKPVRRWKTGFHKIATEVGCPVYLGYFDWGTKRVGRGQKFEISEDPKADMERIQNTYQDMHPTARHHKNYVTHSPTISTVLQRSTRMRCIC